MVTDNSSGPGRRIPSVSQVARPYFTNSELGYLHSLTIPESKKIAYSQKKHQIFHHLFQIIKALKFPLRVLSTSMNYYQRYYLFNKFEEMSDGSSQDLEKDPHTVALTCIFLACKNEDCIKELKYLQSVANKLREQEEDKRVQINSAFNDQQRKHVRNIEFKLLQVIKFDFRNGSNLLSYDQLVVKFAKKLNVDYKVTFYCWLIAFDLMSTPLCLMIPPHCIAISIIIVALNLKPKDVRTKYNKSELETKSPDNTLDSLDCERDFGCPESFVNEGIIYILDYYVHQMKFSVLNEYMPNVDADTGKEQVFKFMELKTRFNDLKVLSEESCSESKLLIQDDYLKIWDYSISVKGSTRFMLGNKRRRFDHELEITEKESDPKEHLQNGMNDLSQEVK